MGILDTLNRAVGGTEPRNVGSSGAVTAQLLAFLESRPGGLTGLLQSFRLAGLGHLFESWVSTGENLPISPEQLKAALGSESTSRMAEATGLPQSTVEQHVATVLPQLIDQLTPHGEVPVGNISGSLEEIGRRFLHH